MAPKALLLIIRGKAVVVCKPFQDTYALVD